MCVFQIRARLYIFSILHEAWWSRQSYLAYTILKNLDRSWTELTIQMSAIFHNEQHCLEVIHIAHSPQSTAF
jgi:hypothetical protein